MGWWPLIAMYASVAVCLYMIDKRNSSNSLKRKELDLHTKRNKCLKRIHIFMSFAGDDHSHKENMMEMMWRTKIGKEEAELRMIEDQIANL